MTDDLSERLVAALHGVYGSHPGHRAAHARGVLCAGTFTATPDAASLSAAAHLAGDPVRVHVRFSTASGDPHARETARDSRGIGIKFYLPTGKTTDIVGLSLPQFFARKPEDVIAFDEARRPDPETGKPDPARVGAYLEAHPESVATITAAISEPTPASFATVAFHAQHAYGFVGPDGTVRHGRYHLLPEASAPPLTKEEVKAAAPDHLSAEMTDRLAAGPAVWHLEVELAGEGDPLDDPTAPWPDDREVVAIGRLEVTGIATDRDRDGDILVFDPTRVTDGIVLTDDPILLARPGAYSASVARRAPS